MIEYYIRQDKRNGERSALILDDREDQPLVITVASPELIRLLMTRKEANDEAVLHGAGHH